MATKALKDMSERELRDMGMAALANMRDVYTEKREGKEITADRELQFDKWAAESDLVEKEFEVRRKEKNMAGDGPTIKGTETQSDEKFDPSFTPDRRTVARAKKKFSRGYAALNAEEKKVYNLLDREERAFEEALIAGFNENNLDEETRNVLRNVEKRAQTTQTTTSGGFLIPQGFIDNMIQYMKYISPFFEEFKASPSAQAQSLFDFRKTTSGNDMPWPSVDDTTNTGELLGENTSIGAALDIAFNRIVLKAYKYSSKPILVPYELFEDSAIDIPGLVAETIGSRIARVINPHFTTGDNSGKPQGIVIGATSGKVTASATAVTFPEVLDLKHSVDPSYRNRPTCRFMFHDSILLYMKKLTVATTTNNARPLWAPGYDVGAPATIDGTQYVINQDMASSVATNSKIMLFGDMKQYAIRMVNDVRAYRLEERYRDLDQTGFVSFIRMDGRTKNTAAIKYLRTT